MKKQRHFDVVILGGGAAGSAAALTLLQNGQRRVAIIEKSDFHEPRVGETIPPDTNSGVIPTLPQKRRWSSGYDGTLPTSRPEFDSRTAHHIFQ